MDRLKKLRACWEATNREAPWVKLQGVARVLMGKLLPGGHEGWPLATMHATTNRSHTQTQANAAFIAEAHTAFPALLEAADLLSMVVRDQDTRPQATRNQSLRDHAQAILDQIEALPASSKD